MKRLRIFLGAILLIGGLYIVVGEHLAGTSADATVNARIAVLRAPVEGVVNFAVRNIGAHVSPEESVAHITDDRFDTARLIDLERAQSALEIDRQRIAAQISAVTEARKVMQAQAKDYKEGRVRQIEARIGEAQAAQESAAAKLREADSALKRTISLNDRGLQTNITLDKAKADYDVAQQDIQGTQQRYNFLSTELAAAKNGVFIGDSYNDAPSSTQRIREFDLRLSELAAESRQVEMRLRQGSEQVSAERVRVNKLTSADLNTDHPSIVWNFLVSGGEYVNRGQDLMRLVDCSTTMVTASVSETVYSRLKVGMPAQFRLNADQRVFDATITRLGGSGASGLYATLAIGPSAEHLSRFDVALDVPSLTGDPDLSCAVGRTGRVVFASGPLSSFREMLARFGL